MTQGTPTDAQGNDELLIDARDLRKRYGEGDEMRAAVDGVSLQVTPGEFVAVLGPSGCGKSTLLGIVGGLDRSFEGSLRLFDQNVVELSDVALAQLRGQRIGFVFQAFHLLGHLSALDNILAPTLFCRGAQTSASKRRNRDRAKKLLDDVGLDGRGDDMPRQLSGGERQRLAIARAMLMEPELLLCDEPTGNLDLVTGEQVVEIFARLHQDEGLTVVAVTHELALANAAERVIQLRAGRILDEGQAA